MAEENIKMVRGRRFDMDKRKFLDPKPKSAASSDDKSKDEKPAK